MTKPASRKWSSAAFGLAMFLFTSPLLGQGGASLVVSGASRITLPGQNAPSQNAIQASIRPLVEYTPNGPTGTILVPFWKQHFKDSQGTVEVHVDLTRPAGPQGATVWVAIDGTALEGVHYQFNSPNPLVFLPGETHAAISITLIPSGEFFRERFLHLVLSQASGASLHPVDKEAQIWIRPSVNPPILSFPSTFFGVTPGSQVMVPVQLSAPSQEPVSLHYSVLPASTLAAYAFAPSGTVVFAPGETNTTLRLVCLPSAQLGQRLILNLQHERKTVVMTIPPLDPVLTTNQYLSSQDVHIDENLWTHSVGGVQEFEHNDQNNLPPQGRAMPGVPTDSVFGGSFYEPGKENLPLIELLPQQNPTPIVDPFSGIPLKMYTIGDAATELVPYLRKSFNATFCGSTTQLYDLPEFMRVSYYLRLPEGADAFRAVPYFRVGVRVRSQDINHGVTFRIGSTGFDHSGNPVPVTMTSLGPIGVWDANQVTPITNLYGIVEDAFGIRVWFCHRLDPSVGFVHDTALDLRYETPGLDRGNPIEYPTWVSTGDGSLGSMGLASLDDATGMGNLPYGFMWEISHSNAIFNGQLRPYFPKPGNWWEPQGNAAINQATSLIFNVQ